MAPNKRLANLPRLKLKSMIDNFAFGASRRRKGVPAAVALPLPALWLPIHSHVSSPPTLLVPSTSRLSGSKVLIVGCTGLAAEVREARHCLLLCPSRLVDERCQLPLTGSLSRPPNNTIGTRWPKTLCWQE